MFLCPLNCSLFDRGILLERIFGFLYIKKKETIFLILSSLKFALETDDLIIFYLVYEGEHCWLGLEALDRRHNFCFESRPLGENLDKRELFISPGNGF